MLAALIAVGLHLGVGLWLGWSTKVEFAASPRMSVVLIQLDPEPSPKAEPTPLMAVAPQSAQSPVPTPAVPLDLPVPMSQPQRRPVSVHRLAPELAASAVDEALAPVPIARAAVDVDDARPDDDSAPAAAMAVMTDWQGRLLAHLERHRRYPFAAQRRRQQGTAWLRFSVDRQGNVVAFRLDRSSGIDALDDEALAVVRRASPVPVPPAPVPGNPVEVVVPVQFVLGRR